MPSLNGQTSGCYANAYIPQSDGTIVEWTGDYFTNWILTNSDSYMIGTTGAVPTIAVATYVDATGLS